MFGSFEDLKPFIVGFLTRWVLKIGGGYFLSVGVSESSVEKIVGSVVAIIVGLIISLKNQKKAIETVSAK